MAVIGEHRRPPSFAARCRHYGLLLKRQIARLRPAALRTALQKPAHRDDVIECYRAILGRDPETSRTAEGHLAGEPSLGDVISKLSHSSELRAKHLRSNIALDRAREPNYLAKSFSGVRSVQAYYGHYGWLVEKLSAPALHSLIASYAPLYVHQSQRSEHHVVITGTHERHEEGELQLQLQNEDQVLYVMGVTIVPGEVFGLRDRHALLISRMQGVPRRFLEIRNATKAFGDIHPKAVLFAVLEGVAAAVGIDAIVGVAAANQIAFDNCQPDALAKVYDEFFLAAGAESLAGRFFLLRLDRPREASIPTDRAHVKRAERKRRRKREIMAIAAAQAHTWLKRQAAREATEQTGAFPAVGEVQRTEQQPAEDSRRRDGAGA